MASNKNHTFIRLEIPMDTLLDHELEMVEQRLELESRERKNVQKRRDWILQALTNQYLFEKHGIVGGGAQVFSAESRSSENTTAVVPAEAVKEPSEKESAPNEEPAKPPMLGHLASSF